MLSREDNERLVRVGPGTEMGRVMRRYWHPVATSRQLPSADCAPFLVKLLGERFVLFRDSAGRPGLLEELCMHRGASLVLGRVEEGGIRCIYHGWKFAIDGTILETPNHADCRLREKMKAPSFPVVESGGILWAYIGPKECQPPFRLFAADQVPDSNRLVIRVNTRTNYLQLWEGGLDSSHVSILHTNQARPSWGAARGGAAPEFQPLDDVAPSFDVEDTVFGYHYAATRRVGADRGGETKRNVRVVPAIMPTGRIIPGPRGIAFLVWETPDDDVSTSTYLSIYGPSAIDKGWVHAMLGLDDARFWSEDDPDFKASWENGFFQDRASMGSNWTGFRGIEQEDACVGLSYGPIYDRSKEHLVAADVAVVRVRRRLMECIRLEQEGKSPLGADLADLTRVWAPDADIDAHDDWRQLARAHREWAARDGG